MTASQSERSIRLDTPVGKDGLLPVSLTFAEELGRCFEIDLVAISEQNEIDPDKILGEAVSIELDLDAGRDPRLFHGHVTEFCQEGYSDGFHQYRLKIRPWLWLLSRTSDCRAFQGMTVPDIVKAVFDEYGFSDVERRLSGTYKEWDYCVQYRETDLNFVSRLLEQEGIYFFFLHERSKHTLVLADEKSAHKACPAYDGGKLLFYPLDELGGDREDDHVFQWTFSRNLHPGAYALADFDFVKPSKDLVAKASIRRAHARATFEMFDYPGEYPQLERKAGEDLAKIRLEELQAQHHVARGSGTAAGLATGHLFSLDQHPRPDQNCEYLVVGSRLSVTSDSYGSGGGSAARPIVGFDCIESSTPFRPARSTPKPLVYGAQSAVVVGKSGEEIWTDEHGRIKVQFHWDRHGRRDENSSCWIRVAQVWAGKQWGGIQIPRIGEEVLVSFLEGDPDRPVVTGRVYNGEAKPPYSLPANATQSGFKSRSSKGGGEENFNELRFEDKKGEEEIYVHAEKNLTAIIENDESIHIQHDDSIKVDNDRKTEIGKNDTENVGKKYSLTAGDQITLTTGMASIVMKKNGDIEISGKNIKIKGMAKVEINGTQKVAVSGLQVEASGTQVKVKGTKTAVEGTMLDLKGSAVAALKGAITKIG